MGQLVSAERGRALPRTRIAQGFSHPAFCSALCPLRPAEITEFTDAVHGVVEGLGSQAEVIEREKLKAIGQRAVVEMERDTRRRKGREVQALIDEKAAELARLEAEYASLLRVEQEQKELIDKLSNNESGALL